MNGNPERVEKLLAMILVSHMKDTPQAEKARALSIAGFANADIAALLGTTGAVINQQLYALRRGNASAKSNKRKH